MISPTTRRSAIPVPSAAGAGRRLTPGSRSTLSRSRDTLLDQPADQVDADTDRELHAFTLLEENIALKERFEQLRIQHQHHSTDQQQQLLVVHSQLSAQRAECERAQQAEAAVRVQLQQAEAAGRQRAEAERTRTEANGVAAVQREAAAGRQQLEQQRLQHDAWAAGVRQQVASVELQLYEANEKIAELVEETGRQAAESACVTAIARALVSVGGGERISTR